MPSGRSLGDGTVGDRGFFLGLQHGFFTRGSRSSSDDDALARLLRVSVATAAAQSKLSVGFECPGLINIAMSMQAQRHLQVIRYNPESSLGVDQPCMSSLVSSCQGKRFQLLQQHRSRQGATGDRMQR